MRDGIPDSFPNYTPQDVFVTEIAFIFGPVSAGMQGAAAMADRALSPVKTVGFHCRMGYNAVTWFGSPDLSCPNFRSVSSFAVRPAVSCRGEY